MECNIWSVHVVRTHGRHMGRECSAADSRHDLQTAWKRTRSAACCKRLETSRCRSGGRPAHGLGVGVVVVHPIGSDLD